MIDYAGRSIPIKRPPAASVYYNSEGKEVYVTDINDSPNSIAKWDDTVSLGPVIKWIRSVTDAEVTSLMTKRN